MAGKRRQDDSAADMGQTLALPRGCGLSPPILFQDSQTKKFYYGDSYRTYGDNHNAANGDYDDFRVNLTAVANVPLKKLERKRKNNDGLLLRSTG